MASSAQQHWMIGNTWQSKITLQPGRSVMANIRSLRICVCVCVRAFQWVNKELFENLAHERKFVALANAEIQFSLSDFCVFGLLRWSIQLKWRALDWVTGDKVRVRAKGRRWETRTASSTRRPKSLASKRRKRLLQKKNYNFRIVLSDDESLSLLRRFDIHFHNISISAPEWNALTMAK